jgi:transmembrane sensor
MRKFTFLRKKIQAKDRALQEKLVNKYFDNLQFDKLDAEKSEGFNSEEVYSRVTDGIDKMTFKPTGNRSKWMVAASLLVVATCSALLFYNQTKILNVISPIAQKQLLVVNGQVGNLTLSDGTKVWLNGGSKLSYPEEFRGDKREITLTGEAFLEVAHDAKRSFIIHTGVIKTQVLGTSFNVKAYPEDDYVKVDVATGKVGVVAPAVKAVLLTPAQQVVINKNDNSAVISNGVDVGALTGWKDGDFIVKNMLLPEVLNVLKHRFNIQVKADANLAKCSISANFTNVSLQNIMRIISKLVKGKFVTDGDNYQLHGKGC